MCSIPPVIDNIPPEVKKKWEDDFHKFQLEVTVVFITFMTFSWAFIGKPTYIGNDNS